MVVLRNATLARAIRDLVNESVVDCNQCGKCTAGCPMAWAMDIQPNQVMRMAQVGAEDRLLRSKAIWLCASCETCATRCPMKVSLAEVMDALRQLSRQRGVADESTRVPQFHDAFLSSVRRFGRTHELSMIGAYKLRTRRLFDDMVLGAKMLSQGKLALMPHRIRGRDEVARILDRLKR